MSEAAAEARLRVMLVSRQPVVRAGLQRLLEHHGGFDIIGECASAGDAVALEHLEPEDVVLLDPDLDEVSLQAVSELVESRHCRVLVFTAATDPALFGHAIELGAAGVLTKDQPADIVVRAIQKVHGGELWLDRTRTALVLTHAMRRGRDPEDLKIQSLTRREREIVSLVGEGLRNGAIAERLFISEATVRNHLTSILSKLALADRFDLAVYAFRHGLLAPAPASRVDTRFFEGPKQFRDKAAEPSRAGRSPGASRP